MGSIDPRLQQVYDTVRPGVEVPVIISTKGPVTDEATTQAQRVGAGSIRFRSALGNSYGATADQATARKLANLPTTDTVFYDEPVSTVDNPQRLGGG